MPVPLQALERGSVLGTSPRVMTGPANRVGAVYFFLYLLNGDGGASHDPVVEGLHHAGPRPGHNWVEVTRLASRAEFDRGWPERLELDREEGRRALLGLIGHAVPPGGHLMVEYDSWQQRDTERELERGVPPALTSLGNLLFSAGCGHGIRNWYIPEGGSEGPRKLQGHRALNDAQARRREEELAREVLSWLRVERGADVRGRARTLLGQLRPVNRETARRVRTALRHLHS